MSNPRGLVVVVDREPRAANNWEGIAVDIADALGARPEDVEVRAMTCTRHGAEMLVKIHTPWAES